MHRQRRRFLPQHHRQRSALEVHGDRYGSSNVRGCSVADATHRRAHVPHLPGDHASHSRQGRICREGECRGGHRVPAGWRDRSGAARAHALAGRAPAVGHVVLSPAWRACAEHADLLHHLLRDGGAAYREHGAPECTQQCTKDIVGCVWPDAWRRADGGVEDVGGQGGRAVHVVRAAACRSTVLPRHHPVCRRRTDCLRRLFPSTWWWRSENAATQDRNHWLFMAQRQQRSLQSSRCCMVRRSTSRHSCGRSGS